MDNTALARFITSFGSLNGYGSSVAQTKKALDDRNTKPLEQSEKDIGIFKDALAGIAVIKKTVFLLMASLRLIRRLCLLRTKIQKFQALA